MSEAQILSANDMFYDALGRGDYELMSRLWSSSRTMRCTHPGHQTLTGKRDVMASWAVILANPEPPTVIPKDETVIRADNVAIVLCLEDLGEMMVVATNVYVFEDGFWRMTDHHASQTALSKRA